MALLSSLFALYQAGRTAHAAVDAAAAKLQVGGSVFEAIDAFAAATPTPLDDVVVADLHLAADRALTAVHFGAHGAAQVAQFIEQHAPAVIAFVAMVGATCVKAEVRIAALSQRRAEP